MGGLFSSPKPQVVPAPGPAPLPSPSPAPEPAGQAARVEARAAVARGLAGTIATSARGVLDPLPLVGRKSLLGE